MTIVQALQSGLRRTHEHLRLLLLPIVLNAVALGLFYFFLRTTEASVWELAISLVLALSTLFLFLLTQAGIFGLVAQTWSARSPAGEFFRQGVRNGWRFLLAVLPVGLLGYGLLLAQHYVVKNAVPILSAGPATAAFVILWFVLLPLMLITLWTSVVKNGLAYSYKNGLQLMFGRALAPRSLSVYLLSFPVFAVLPYFLIVVKTPFKSAWLELAVFLFRLGLAYLIAIYGWTVMAGALTSLMNDDPFRGPVKK